MANALGNLGILSFQFQFQTFHMSSLGMAMITLWIPVWFKTALITSVGDDKIVSECN